MVISVVLYDMRLTRGVTFTKRGNKPKDRI